MEYLFNGISKIQSDKKNTIDNTVKEIEKVGKKVTVAKYSLNQQEYYSICAIVEGQSKQEVENKVKACVLFRGWSSTEL